MKVIRRFGAQCSLKGSALLAPYISHLMKIMVMRYPNRKRRKISWGRNSRKMWLY